MLKTYLCRNGNQARNQPSDDGGGSFFSNWGPLPVPSSLPTVDQLLFAPWALVYSTLHHFMVGK